MSKIISCDCCSEPIVGDYMTDDEVCQGSDAPGFCLCDRPECRALHENLTVADRRALYSAGRERSIAALLTAIAPLTSDDSDKVIAAMPPISITIPTLIKPELLWDTLTSAFEGGSNYWITRYKIAEPATACKHTYIQDIPILGGALLLYTIEGEWTKPLTLGALVEGATLMASKYPRHFSDMVSDDGRADATTGDVLLQMSLFGDIVFG